ncbi:matrix metalloproteinase-25 [Spea bombifrons]|uniref:matrix metalloproteinase-25 n=1 Tax=Spea bombifrons TaxID=233779 RepID=UPI00234A2873|nr:matrix metalloproteinase-25 [Spea bombifrons]
MLLKVWMLWGSLALTGCSPSAKHISQGVDWLTRYGYLPPPDPFSAQQQTLDALKEALRTMQMFAGVPVTGEMDDETFRMMQKPRCSLPDVIMSSEVPRRRRRRYAFSGTVWEKKELKWRVESFPDTLRQDETRELMGSALRAWSRETQLTFYETHGEADLRVGFLGGSHGDGYPFDGPGGTLGHAFFPGVGPSAGDTHMDADEHWTYNNDQGTDLFAVAVHEFGHSLGLSHSSSEDSIMKPYYQGTVGDHRRYRLPKDDVDAIQILYGKRDEYPGPAPAPPVPTHHFIPPRGPTYKPRLPLADRCSTHFDAIASIRGEVFFFKNKYFWRVQSSGQLISLSPAHLNRFWLGLPYDLPKIDAVYERANDSRIVFIAGNQYWVFQDTKALPGYPRPVSDFGLGTDGIDAAFVWKQNRKTYFFRGSKFWRFDDNTQRPDAGYPHDVSLWQGLSPNIDDVISGENGSTYFFKGSEYWKFQHGKMEAEPGYPRSIARHWMYCHSDTEPEPTEQPEGRGQRDCYCPTGRNSAVKASSGGTFWVALGFLVAICTCW